MPEDNDQDIEGVKNDQPNDEQSKLADEKKYTLEEAIELAQKTQSGVAQFVGITKERMDRMEETLQQIVEKTNQQTGAAQGDDEYLTVGKLREVLTQQAQAQAQFQEQSKTQAESYVRNTIATLRAEGIIASDIEEKEFADLAMEMGEADLSKAAIAYAKIKESRQEAGKEKAKTKARQEEGSKVGTSSKSSGEESRGVEYNKVKSGDWYTF